MIPVEWWLSYCNLYDPKTGAFTINMLEEHKKMTELEQAREEIKRLRISLEMIKYNVLSKRAGDGDERSWQAVAEECRDLVWDALGEGD